MIKTLIMYSGHVESTTVACLIVSHKKGFKTADEALVEFGRTANKEVLKKRAEKCCQGFKKARKTSQYCDSCGASILQSAQVLDPDHLSEAVDTLLSAAIVDVDWDSFTEDGWDLSPVTREFNPFANPDQVLVITQDLPELVSCLLFRSLRKEGRKGCATNAGSLPSHHTHDVFLLNGKNPKWGFDVTEDIPL